MGQINLNELDARLREVEGDMKDTRRGCADCRDNYGARIKMLEDWKDKSSWGLLAILITSGLSTAGTIFVAILVWVLNHK